MSENSNNAHSRRKFFEAVPAGRRKKLKLLDINSDAAIEDTTLPDEEEAEQLLPAEIGLMYRNKFFYLEQSDRKYSYYTHQRQVQGANAVMYSIVETAKANNLNIFQYLYTVLLYMPDYMNSSAEGLLVNDCRLLIISNF